MRQIEIRKSNEDRMFLSPYVDILSGDGDLIILRRRDTGEKLCFGNVNVHAARCIAQSLQEGMTEEEIVMLAENAGLSDVLDLLLDQCICKGMIE